jgi:hypothetical protein
MKFISKYLVILSAIFLIGNTMLGQISGTTNYLSKFTSANTIGNSIFYELSDKVGIGTMSPLTKLDVLGGSGWVHTGVDGLQDNLQLGNWISPYSTNPLYKFQTNDVSTDLLRIYSQRWGADIEFARSGSTGDRKIARLVGAEGVDASFLIYNANNESKIWLNTGGNTYFNGGNIGIGTTNPTNKLEVVGRIQVSETGTNYATLGFQNTNGIIQSGKNAAGSGQDLINIFNGGSGISVAYGGNVGIRTTAPAQIFTVNAGGSNGGIQIQSTTGQNIVRYYQTDAGTNLKYFQQGIYAGKGFISGVNDATTAETYRFITFDMSNGNVGIGTTNPGVNLDIQGIVRARNLSGSGITLNASGAASNNFSGANFYLIANNNAAAYGLTNPGSQANVMFRTDNWVGTFVWGRTKSPGGLADFQEYMRINDAGNVGIGTTTTGNCKLAVEGMIGAREVQVVASSWPDYVFDESYKLDALDDVEQMIKTDKHLPGIPSKEEVEKDGVKLGEMQTKLLQKVEEMTLYLIEQNKKIDNQNERIQRLERENEELRKK